MAALSSPCRLATSPPRSALPAIEEPLPLTAIRLRSSP
jgi:hypothetical protein